MQCVSTKQTLRIKWWSRKKWDFFLPVDEYIGWYHGRLCMGRVWVCFLFVVLSIWFMRNVSIWNGHCECQQICGFFFHYSKLPSQSVSLYANVCTVHTIFASVWRIFFNSASSKRLLLLLLWIAVKWIPKMTIKNLLVTRSPDNEIKNEPLQLCVCARVYMCICVLLMH